MGYYLGNGSGSWHFVRVSHPCRRLYRTRWVAPLGSGGAILVGGLRPTRDHAMVEVQVARGLGWVTIGLSSVQAPRYHGAVIGALSLGQLAEGYAQRVIEADLQSCASGSAPAAWRTTLRGLGATLGAGAPRSRDERRRGTRVVVDTDVDARGRPCPPGYHSERTEVYRDGVLFYGRKCVRNPVCIDASTIFTVDDTPLLFSWKLLNAAGVEEQFTSPPTTIRSLFGGATSVTGYQLARAALRRFARGRTGVSPVCISYVPGYVAPAVAPPADAGGGWDIVGDRPSSAGTPPPPPPPAGPSWRDGLLFGGGGSDSGVDAGGGESSCGGGGSPGVNVPPGTEADGPGPVDAPPGTDAADADAADADADASSGSSSFMTSIAPYKGVIAVVALAAAAYAGWRVYKAGKGHKKNRRRRNARGLWDSSRHVSSGHYRVSDAEAGRIARGVGRALPQHGRELSVVVDGVDSWLSRTPYGRGYADSPKRGWIWVIRSQR